MAREQVLGWVPEQLMCLSEHLRVVYDLFDDLSIRFVVGTLPCERFNVAHLEEGAELEGEGVVGAALVLLDPLGDDSARMHRW